jgi:transcriptional regulator with XRE-family HTH domain
MMRRRPAHDPPSAHEALLIGARFAPGSLSAGTPRRHEASHFPPILWKPVLQDSQESPTDAPFRLGARVRELRRVRGLTLKALGQEAGLSHPFLSQLERGLARPSVGSVERIARALGVPVSALWTRPPLENAIVVRSDEGAIAGHPQENAPGALREIFAGRPALRLREWTGGARAWPAEPETTTGEVSVYVVRGVVEVDLAGTVHRLREGDAVLFDGSIPHRLRRLGGASTRVLYVATS